MESPLDTIYHGAIEFYSNAASSDMECGFNKNNPMPAPAPGNPETGFRRYIFNTLTVVSLLMLLATVGFWVLVSWLSPNL